LGKINDVVFSERRIKNLAKIAVEKPYEDVKKALEEKGHTVQMFSTDENVSGFDMGVVRAINEGHNDEFQFPVVAMSGMSIDNVLDAVEHRLNQI
jgi:2-oxo-4-hydroxy-4-carboxy--5-ureidoimidazoline (OHCU) decarboxylase